jgi:two-component system sensor histidine kinase KdpD
VAAAVLPLVTWLLGPRRGDRLPSPLVVFMAAAVSAVVDLAVRRTGQATRASADAEVLSNLSCDVLRGQYALTRLLDRLRETFGLTSVTLLERPPEVGLTPDRQRDPTRWRAAATVGALPCASPDEGDADIAVGEDLALVLRGRPLPASERRIVEAFAAQAAAALRQERLTKEAEKARPLVEVDRMRTALLNAVSHPVSASAWLCRAASPKRCTEP